MSIESDIAQLKSEIAALKNRYAVENGGEATRQGRQLAFSAGSEPTIDGTGVFTSPNGETWDDGTSYYQWGLVNEGTLKVGASTNGDLTAANGDILINESGISAGGRVAIDGNGILVDGGENILMDTTNFDGVLDLSASGGFSNVFTGANGIVRGIAVYGTGWLVWGDFSQLNGYSCRYIGILSSAGAVTNIGIGLDGTVLCAVVSGNDVWFGGNFLRRIATGLEGGGISESIQLNYLAYYNGSAISAMSHTGSTGANGVPRCMALSGSSLIIGGDFTELLGYSAARIGNVSTSTYVVTAMGAGLNSTCYDVKWSGSDVLAAGAFTGTPAYIGKYSGGSWSTPGTSPPTSTLYSVIVGGSDFYVGGTGGVIKKLTGGAGAWASVGAPPAGTVYALAIDGLNLYAGYDAGEYCQYYNGSAWTSLGSGLNGTVYALLLDTTMIIAGAFTTADGITMYRLTRYSPSSAPSSLSLQTIVDTLDDHEHWQVLFFGGNVSVGAGNTEYGGFGSNSGATQGDWKYTFPAGSFKDMRVRTASAQPANNKMTCTMQVNGTDSTLTVDITSALGIGTVSDTTHTVTISAEDEINFEWDNLANATSATIAGCTVLFRPA